MQSSTAPTTEFPHENLLQNKPVAKSTPDCPLSNQTHLGAKLTPERFNAEPTDRPQPYLHRESPRVERVVAAILVPGADASKGEDKGNLVGMATATVAVPTPPMTAVIVELEYLTEGEQNQEMNRLAQESPNTQPDGAEITHAKLMAYAEQSEDILLRDSLAALLRQSESSPKMDQSEDKQHERESVSEDFLQTGQLRYQFVMIPAELIPPYVSQLFGLGSLLQCRPLVFRILIKNETPRYAEFVSNDLLADLEWHFCCRSQTFRRCKLGQSKSTCNLVFVVAMNGRVERIYRPDDITELLDARLARLDWCCLLCDPRHNCCRFDVATTTSHST
ncbi:uncharacterized protein BP01DRAFT_384918 [Aspergillus saccharolyticus JOP 1030-1]|uniref:Uncharacterized protein n=1 Tax=Aspergillus saccharolyticus JOP 1030-1 TaxID=1450539 RepID=A0A318ZSB7_9EURO|nr:hypothetical protein BP01DRAFT_384918 [Aspergillus saccharolyticus JOP 1030-1]PYH42968.1 hypothetical protein BP01DRAFT_384918 [Aspergillus saccharolyticus JOP 1030-1]